ncbi:MAG TPA: aminotransferase class I/II-fold pyridoxal phosphate-dependent enzyme, partial [Anaerolineae bacterium]
VIASEAKQSPSRDVEIASSQSFDSASLRSGSLLATLAPHASAGVTQAKLIFLANPSNPDGGMASRAEIERLLALPVMLVLDEAYAEFAGESYAARVPTQSNLIVLRTFSKWAGLASLRVGYCIAPQPIAAKILQIKAPENVNSAGIMAALASLDDHEYLMANVRRIIEERERLSVALAQLGFLQPLPSHANFVLCRVVGRDARQIYNALAARGILIRVFGLPRLRDYIRIAVGTPEQNEILVKALKELDADKRGPLHRPHTCPGGNASAREG